MNTKLQGIHEASMRILERTGVKFHHPDAIAKLKENGIRVEDGVAFFTEEQIMHWVGMAPATFTVTAPNPKYSVTIGGDQVYVGPASGCPIVSDQDGNKRNATLEDYVKAVKLYETNPTYSINGGLIMQPDDFPIDYASLLMQYTAMLHSEKTLFSACGNYHQMEAELEMISAYFGGAEEIKKNPRVITIVNMNTPLQLDNNMTETLFTFAKYGQPICVTSAAMAGSTSPVTLAGTITMVNCEVLAGIALVQMVNPGNPVCYGSQTTSSDMATGAIAIGSPEGALCYRYAAQMAKFYNLPCRSGGSLTDTKVVDGQSGFESMLTLKACSENKVNIIMQSSGILDGYTSFSFQKLISDFEAIDYLRRYERDIEVNEDTIPEDLIHKVGQNGMFLTEMHTFMHCRQEPHIPAISVRGAVPSPTTQFLDNINARIEKLLASYQKPVLNEEGLAAMKKVVHALPIDKTLLERIETM